MTTDERLESLEKALGDQGGSVSGCWVTMGLAAGTWILAGFLHGEKRGRQTTKPGSDSSEMIRARVFVVVDENGKPRAELTTTRTGCTEAV